MMKILRFILFLFLVIVPIHTFEVVQPTAHNPTLVVSPDTLMAFERIRALNRTYFDLQVSEYFWKNRIASADEPSFIVTADLKDSMITLDIQGVPIHQAKIAAVQLSRGLKDSLYQSSLLEWIQLPFKLKSFTATISKEPVQERYISSRREAESQLIHLRDPEDSSFVSISLEFDRGLNFVLREVESEAINYPLFPEIIADTNKVIVIHLGRFDALAIYRAIPENTSLILNL